MDFIILWPEVGVAVLEVKGGNVTPNEDATFTQKDAKESREIDPMGQATSNAYELKRFLGKKSSIQNFSARPSVVLPYADIPSSYSRPTIPRTVIHDHVDIVSLADRIMKDLLSHHFRPSALEIHAILGALSVPLAQQKSLTELGLERENQVVALTEQQFAILDLCIAMPKF